MYVNGESCVVRFNDCIRHLWRWDDRERCHHAIGVVLTDFVEQKRAHTGTSTATERMGDLNTLETVAGLHFTSNNIQNLID